MKGPSFLREITWSESGLETESRVMCGGKKPTHQNTGSMHRVKCNRESSQGQAGALVGAAQPCGAVWPLAHPLPLASEGSGVSGDITQGGPCVPGRGPCFRSHSPGPKGGRC